MTLEEEHGDYMKQVIQLACQNLKRPFASLIVDHLNGEVIAEGLNKSYKNPTLHSELAAIANAAERHGEDLRWADCTLYTTAEPNPMNMSAILWTGIPRVVFGSRLETLQKLGYRSIDIPAREVVDRARGLTCELLGQVLESECDALFTAAARLERVQ